MNSDFSQEAIYVGWVPPLKIRREKPELISSLRLQATNGLLMYTLGCLFKRLRWADSISLCCFFFFIWDKFLNKWEENEVIHLGSFIHPSSQNDFEDVLVTVRGL